MMIAYAHKRLAKFITGLMLITGLIVLLSTAHALAQTYWYCWDTGDPSPHHLGYPVAGDHYCSNAELGISPSNTDQGNTNGAKYASDNNAYIASNATSNGTDDGTANGNGASSSGQNSQANTFCSQPVKFNTPQAQDYVDAYQRSYDSACVPIYDAAYTTAYTTAYKSSSDLKQKADATLAAKNAATDHKILLIIGVGIVAIIIGSALWRENRDKIIEWYANS
jgi:hypothetical protein